MPPETDATFDVWFTTNLQGHGKDICLNVS